MALLHKKRISEIPKEAVKLSPEEAIEYQWNIIKKWKPQNEMWPFTYGVGIISIASGLTGMYLNNYFRTKFRLFDYGRIATYVPNAVFPVVVLGIMHHTFITNDIIIQKTECPVCIELRGIALQVGFGLVYPCLLVPLSTAFATKYYGSYKLPNIIQEPLETGKFFMKLYRPLRQSLMNCAALQVILGAAFTYFEMNRFYKMQERMLEEDNIRRSITYDTSQ